MKRTITFEYMPPVLTFRVVIASTGKEIEHGDKKDRHLGGDSCGRP